MFSLIYFILGCIIYYYYYYYYYSVICNYFMGIYIISPYCCCFSELNECKKCTYVSWPCDLCAGVTSLDQGRGGEWKNNQERKHWVTKCHLERFLNVFIIIIIIIIIILLWGLLFYYYFECYDSFLHLLCVFVLLVLYTNTLKRNSVIFSKCSVFKWS